MTAPRILLFAAAAWALAGMSGVADAHAIAGNRLFPGTLTFDDPAVLDEADLPFVSTERVPRLLGGTDRQTTLNDSVTRLLWPGFAISVDSNWTVQNSPGSTQTGFGPTNLSFKGLLFEDDLHETLVSGSLAWGVAGLGNPAILDTPDNVITPDLLFGRGFGDLPDQLSWLRPFGLTGSLSVDFPTASTSRITPSSPLLGNPTILHTAFAVEFTTLYLTDRFVPGQLPPQEPLNQWVPLVEFQFDSPLDGGYGRKTAGTMNPGVSYVFDKYQLSLEGIVPLNRAGGSGLGVRAGVILFIDDLIPSLFGKPVFH